MGEDAADQVPACRIAAEEDRRRVAVRLGQDIPHGGDSLLQLGWVCCLWSEGVGKAEDGDALAGAFEVADDVRIEFEVAHVGGQTEATTCIVS